MLRPVIHNQEDLLIWFDVGIKGGKGVTSITPGLKPGHLVIWWCYYWFGEHWIRNKFLWRARRWVGNKSSEVNVWPIKLANASGDIRKVVICG